MHIIVRRTDPQSVHCTRQPLHSQRIVAFDIKLVECFDQVHELGLVSFESSEA